MFGENEIYKYLGILKADANKQSKQIEKIKNIKDEWETFSKPNSVAGI